LKTRSSWLPGLLLTVALGLALAACGGGGESSEDKISSTIETAATSTDPAVCNETQTLNFMEQTTGSSGREAEKQCEEQAESGENNPDSVKVSEVEVEGEKATANAEFKGGNFDGQTLTLALVEEEGEWKLDELTGFVNFDPAKLIAVLAGKLKEEASIEPRIASCIVEGMEELPDKELESLVLENNSGPIVEIAEGCE
jgi:ABC-type glycerol-3-phosphate transport system substrate-binding protein